MTFPARPYHTSGKDINFFLRIYAEVLIAAPTPGDFAAARDGKDAAYAREYDAKYAERLKTELY